MSTTCQVLRLPIRIESTATLTAFDPKAQRATYDVTSVFAAKGMTFKSTHIVDLLKKVKEVNVPAHGKTYIMRGKSK